MSFLIRKCSSPVWKELRRQYTSALYIPRSKQTDICVTVRPFIDIEERLENVESLKENIALRRCSHDVEKLRDIWDFYTNISRITSHVLQQKRETVEELKELSKDSEKNSQQIEKYTLKLDIIKKDLHNLKTTLGSIEETVIVQSLKLPNVLHPATPKLNKIERFNHLKIPSNKEKCEHHIDIATKLKLIKFNSPHNYYLLNEAALFELSSKFYFSTTLKSLGFTQFSNPDFAKSAIVEGCGMDHTNPDDVFILHEEEKSDKDLHLHLTGGGSTTAFAAYFTRFVVNSPGNLPLQLYTSGRQYKPVPKISQWGLLRVSQADVIEVFCVVKDSVKSFDEMHEKLVNIIIELYKKLGYHFKVFYLPAPELAPWETLRLSVQMYSSFFKQYVEVGNLSLSDSYISKRLQFCYKDDGLKFPKVISGTIFNVPKVLACVIEETGELKLPKVLLQHSVHC